MEEPLFVRQHDVPLQWHEAVAVLRSVIDALDDGRIQSVPPPGELALESDGSLHVSPRAAAAAAGAAQPSPALRELLRQLLPADAPSELRALTEDGGSTPVTTLADFRRALAFFERPSHERDRRALVARLTRIAEERQLESEIERLSRKARTEEQPPAGPRRPAPAAPTRHSFRKVLLALAALGVVAGVAVGFRSVSTGSVWPVATAGQSGAVGKAIIGKLREAARSAFGTPVSPPQTISASVERPAPANERRRRARQPNAATISPSSVLPPQPSLVPLDSRRLELAMLPTLVPSWSPPELLFSPYSTIIHDRSDFEVIPPVLLRPHLPTVGSVGESTGQLGTVDVVVAEDGRVEQVRLVRTNAERRFYDAMILAAVKSWRFRPASRSGQPVRYRVQITLS